MSEDSYSVEFPDDAVMTVADMDGDGTFTFNDFVARNHYQLAGFTDEALAQNTKVDESKVSGRMAMNNIDRLEANSVAINNTLGIAIVSLAEQGPDDPAKGAVTHVAIHQSENVYVFKENVTVHPDGTVTSGMEDGQSWQMSTLQDRAAYQNLVERFGYAADPGMPSITAEFEKQSGRDLAVGGVENTAGEVEFRQEEGRAAVASASDMNDGNAVEFEQSFGPGGDAEIKLSLFRENAEGMVVETETAPAPGDDNQAKYENYAGRPEGIVPVP